MKIELNKGILLSWIAITLAACGGGGGGGDNVVTEYGGYIKAPPPPQDVTVENDADGNIVLDWSVAEREDPTTYYIYWSTLGHSDLENKTNSINVSEPPFIHEDLSPGTTYFYTITAVDYVLESAFSTGQLSATAGVPTKPHNFTAESVYSDINLSWEPAARADTHTVSWSNGLGESGTIDFATSPFLHTGLVGVEYEYVITASNAYGESVIVEAAASPDLPPETPVNLYVGVSKAWRIPCLEESGWGVCVRYGSMEILGNQVAVSWSDLGTDYEVHRVSPPSGTAITTSHSHYSTLYSDTASPADSYCFYVIAQNEFGTSVPTDTVCGVEQPYHIF